MWTDRVMHKQQACFNGYPFQYQQTNTSLCLFLQFSRTAVVLCLKPYNYSLSRLFSSHPVYYKPYRRTVRRTVYNALINNHTDKWGNSRGMSLSSGVLSPLNCCTPNSTKTKMLLSLENLRNLTSRFL